LDIYNAYYAYLKPANLISHLWFSGGQHVSVRVINTDFPHARLPFSEWQPEATGNNFTLLRVSQGLRTCLEYPQTTCSPQNHPPLGTLFIACSTPIRRCLSETFLIKQRQIKCLAQVRRLSTHPGNMCGERGYMDKKSIPFWPQSWSHLWCLPRKSIRAANPCNRSAEMSAFSNSN